MQGAVNADLVVWRPPGWGKGRDSENGARGGGRGAEIGGEVSGAELGAHWRGRVPDIVWLGSEEGAVLQPARTGITM